MWQITLRLNFLFNNFLARVRNYFEITIWLGILGIDIVDMVDWRIGGDGILASQEDLKKRQIVK